MALQWLAAYGKSNPQRGYGFSVFGESQECGTKQQNSKLVSAERRADRTKMWPVFLGSHRLFDVSTHRDPTRLNACFENCRR